jgi:AcrR family transcriptional regulator
VAGGHPQSVFARPRRLDARRNLEAIVDAARRALAANPDASMQEVAEAAGVHRATVHRHFATREELLRAVHEQAWSEAARALEAARPGQGPARAALERVTDAAIGVLDRYRLPGFAPVDDGTVASILERGQREDGLRADVPPAVLATAWSGLLPAMLPREVAGAEAGALVVQVLLGPERPGRPGT